MIVYAFQVAIQVGSEAISLCRLGMGPILELATRKRVRKSNKGLGMTGMEGSKQHSVGGRLTTTR